MKSLIIIPTYNEKENIAAILIEVLRWAPDAEFLVVDDNSPDGTASIVLEVQKQNPKVHLLSREKKAGLGKAYLAGFRWGIENNFDYLVEMDADFSHRPEDLRKILDAKSKYDFVVGSRYVAGGDVENWPWSRLLISRFGSLYSRVILGFPLRDWTGGFNLWHKDTLKRIGLDGVRSEGYSFQIELKYKALKAGCRGHEVPILFADRRAGQSKMSMRIVFEAMMRVWVMRFGT
jgi:dolichol-phosphate mannosyltransferase